MRGEYTRVYTIVYTRVHYCIHTCTLPRSKYILRRARLYVYSLGITSRLSAKTSWRWNYILKEPKTGLYERDHASHQPPSILSASLVISPRAVCTSL